jgi:hypothetical protein
MDRIFSVIIIHFANVEAVKCNSIHSHQNYICNISLYRLNRGAFAQSNLSISKSVQDTNVIPAQIPASSTMDNSSTNQNIIVSTRLRQTEKRLRKYQNQNGQFTSLSNGIKSKNTVRLKF